jgi:hypothetical protein
MDQHTVDSHLRHVFGKLGINSRVGLARLAGEHDPFDRGTGGSGDEQTKAEFRRIEVEQVAVAFGPPA